MNDMAGAAPLAAAASPHLLSGLSLVHGPSLADEPGLGALTLPGYLREVTQRYAGREAAVMRRPGGGMERWSYGEVWDRSVEVARALVAAGVKKDTRVGILMSNRLEYLSALFGTALAGGVAVALSTFSTPPELTHLLQASAVSILLFERQVVKQDFVAMLGELEPKLAGAAGPVASTTFPFLERLVALESVSAAPGAADGPLPGAIDRWADFLAKAATISPEAVEARAAIAKPSDTGMLFFSSGTTSLPKGILHAQRALAVQWWRWPRIMRVDAERHPVRSWTGNGLFWSGNLSMLIGNAWSCGGAVVLQPTFEADEALELIGEERVSFPIGRPHQWARLQSSPKWPTADLSSLHYVTYSDILASHPTFDTPWTTPLSFGTTETLTVITTVFDSAVDDAAGGHGRPLPGNIIKIFDPHSGALVPLGARGEIGVKGPTLMLGYIGKTLDEAFDEDGYYRTGDGGYFDPEGRLFWEGRLTDIIKTGGANVSPLEIDAALSNCPGVKRGVTVGVPHETLSEMVVACVVRHEGFSLDEDEVRAFLKARLASYKIPRAVLFFREDEFAVTGNEKIKTGALRELARARLAETAA